jgi:hypothetical protein
MPDIRNFFGAKPAQGTNTAAKPAAKEVGQAMPSSAIHLVHQKRSRRFLGEHKTAQMVLYFINC